MRILFITQYYLPETGAPQNRISGIANEFLQLGAEVEVLTAMPNYPQMKIHESYRGRFAMTEEINGITVNRAWIYATQKRNVFSRLLNYFSFVITSLLIHRRIKGKFDFVICESPPLFLGISAVFISKWKMAKFIFNVSDLWPESAIKLKIVEKKLMLNIAWKLESWLYRKSSLVSGQTQGICDNIKRRFPQTKVYWLPNGIDPSRFDPRIKSSWKADNNFKEEDFIILYAGILGHAQGLECVIHAAEKLKDSRVKFVFLGNGPEEIRLIELTQKLNLTNVFFFDSVSRENIPSIVSATDAAVIPLKRLDIFKGAIPSKIFENLAMEKPILLGVEGEAKELFIDHGRAGLNFTPDDSDDLVRKINELISNPKMAVEMGKNGREYVIREFNRRKLAESFLKKLNEL